MPSSFVALTDIIILGRLCQYINSDESTDTYNEADYPIEEVRRMENDAVRVLDYNYY